MSNLEIKKIIEVNAPVEIVFKALTDIDELIQWWPDKGTFEPRVGGKMHFEFIGNNHHKLVKAGQVLNGEILEFVQNKTNSYL